MDKRLKKLNLPDNYPNPKNMKIVILGASMSGKTHFMNELMKKYNGYYDCVFVFSPTAENNEEDKMKFHQLKDHFNKPPEIIDDFRVEEIKELWDEIKEENKERKKNKMDKLKILFIFDDCITNKNLFNSHNSTVIDDLFVRGRHDKINVIVLSQIYKALSKCIRQANPSHLIILDIGRKMIRDLSEEHCTSQITPVDLENLICQHFEKTKYEPIILDYTTQSDKRIKDHTFSIKKSH
jgi:flavodoxin